MRDVALWVGEGVEIDDVEGVEGPAFIGNYTAISPESSVGPYTVLGPATTLRERARLARTVVDSSCMSRVLYDLCNCLLEFENFCLNVSIVLCGAR